MKPQAMHESGRFETPENVQVHYTTAGPGTRFIAWFVDQILLWLLIIVATIVLLIAGFTFESVFDKLDGNASRDDANAVLFASGILAIIWGISSFVYFGGCELLLRGQTVGKRLLGIRVVMADGFQLDATSILVRNLFRVVDNLPPLWIVPVISRRGQRMGDMVAGTLVVGDSEAQLSSVRVEMAQRSTAEAQFRFDYNMLKRMTASDFAAVERMLSRLWEISPEQREKLLRTFADQIAQKLEIDPPLAEQRVQFLEDLFAAELRRQDRNLV